MSNQQVNTCTDAESGVAETARPWDPGVDLPKTETEGQATLPADELAFVELQVHAQSIALIVAPLIFAVLVVVHARKAPRILRAIRSGLRGRQS